MRCFDPEDFSIDWPENMYLMQNCFFRWVVELLQKYEPNMTWWLLIFDQIYIYIYIFELLHKYLIDTEFMGLGLYLFLVFFKFFAVRIHHQKRSSPFGKTFLETNMSYPKALLKIIFLCPVWWDMNSFPGGYTPEN